MALEEPAAIETSDWVTQHRRCRALLCLQIRESPLLRVGVVMLVENKRTGSNSRVLWELVDDKVTGELKFQEARELPYRTWATSVNPTNSGAATIYRAKKPEDFLKRHLLSAQPSNSSSLSPGRGRTTVSEEDWLDLDKEEDVNQLLRTAASVKKELRPFPVARAAGIPYRPMLFTLHLDLRDADPVTRNFHSLRAAVMKAVSGGDIGRAEIIARCPDLARQDDPGAAFDRVLQMDSWCGHCGETLPDNALASELHEYRRNGAPPTYGLSQNVACTICGHPDNPHDMALCDRCGCGVHQACMGQDLRQTFEKALGNNADWFCHCEPTQESAAHFLSHPGQTESLPHGLDGLPSATTGPDIFLAGVVPRGAMRPPSHQKGKFPVQGAANQAVRVHDPGQPSGSIKNPARFCYSSDSRDSATLPIQEDTSADTTPSDAPTTKVTNQGVVDGALAGEQGVSSEAGHSQERPTPKLTSRDLAHPCDAGTREAERDGRGGTRGRLSQRVIVTRHAEIEVGDRVRKASCEDTVAVEGQRLRKRPFPVLVSASTRQGGNESGLTTPRPQNTVKRPRVHGATTDEERTASRRELEAREGLQRGGEEERRAARQDGHHNTTGDWSRPSKSAAPEQHPPAQTEDVSPVITAGTEGVAGVSVKSPYPNRPRADAAPDTAAAVRAAPNERASGGEVSASLARDRARGLFV